MDAIALFNQTALECSKLITKRYSTSFTLGIRALDKKYHLPIYGIYGFVRYADEIVDTFHDYDKKSLLKHFREETQKAIDEKISFNPVLHAFQLIVNQYAIEYALIEAFLDSMEMDLEKTDYTPEGYRRYIYGSAEVVGLMCLRVFCEGNDTVYQSLKEPACKLGSAFQKVNFLRDMKSDYDERGRTYFPGLNYEKFNQTVKREIEADIAIDFSDALEGIKKLPAGARLGVYLAYKYYLKLFIKIRNLSPETIASTRIRIPNAIKLSLLLKTYCGVKLGLD
ncbi:phytoene/squalene synthase family protein [Anditalea andensis]|uniref:Phytoene synthase n=1 Tax=Anditalea andensis TaxID=1048983 RepID=A0A074L0V6_9BACT|nr:phytoene/squalene synthase family protein [Anditalea andensis]KEO73488.1 phytoene synthase [Anditalea andensis]